MISRFLPIVLEKPYGDPPEGKDVLWRVEAKRYSIVLDAEADRYGVSDPHIEARWYTVTKRTPKGAWIDTRFYQRGSECIHVATYKRFVLLTAVKRWACNTVDEALWSFIARRDAQIRILTSRLNRAKDEREMAKSLVEAEAETAEDMV